MSEKVGFGEYLEVQVDSPYMSYYMGLAVGIAENTAFDLQTVTCPLGWIAYENINLLL